MTVAHRLGALVLALAAACNGRFAFDQAVDAGNGRDGALRSDDDSPGTDDTARGGDAALPFDGSSGPAACSPQSPLCFCSGTLCSCSRQQWCRFDGAGCGPTSGSCAFLCHNGTRCEGQCQHGCHLECENGSTCNLTMGEAASAEAEASTLTVTIGAQSHVQCENNAICHVVCMGACTVTCQGGARCDLRCAGDTLPHSADAGGACNH